MHRNAREPRRSARVVHLNDGAAFVLVRRSALQSRPHRLEFEWHSRINGRKHACRSYNYDSQPGAQLEGLDRGDRYEAGDAAGGSPAEYLSSGLSREAFCTARGFLVQTLARYVTRYRRQLREGGGEASAPAAKPRFLAVDVREGAAGGGYLAVVLVGGRRIEVSRGFEEETLRRLVAALDRG